MIQSSYNFVVQTREFHVDMLGLIESTLRFRNDNLQIPLSASLFYKGISVDACGLIRIECLSIVIKDTIEHLKLNVSELVV